MKSERLLSTLMLLQGHGRLSTRQIADRLEISQRTAHRDMEALCAAGVPLIAYRGAQGGWELEKGWRTQVPALDAAELQGLLMAQPNALGGTPLAAAAHRAFDKLMAALPASTKAQANSIRARLHFDPAGWRMPGDDLSMLPIVQDALARDRKLTFLYTRADGESTTRTVDPLGIVCKQTAWYLVARTPNGMRTFRISRMRNAVILALECERPGDFDLAAHWKSSTARFAEKQKPFAVILALSHEGYTALLHWCAMRIVPDHPALAALEPGWQAVAIEFDSYSQARFVAMGLGMRVQVLDPRALADEVAAEQAALCNRVRG